MKENANTIDIPEIKLDVMEERKVIPEVEPMTKEQTLTPVSFRPKWRNPLRSLNLKGIFRLRKNSAQDDKKNNKGHRVFKIAGIILAGILVLIVVLGVAIAIPGFAIYGKVKVLQTDVADIKAAVSKQNITMVKTATTKL